MPPLKPDLKIIQLSYHLPNPPTSDIVLLSFSVINVGRGVSPRTNPGVYVNAVNPTPPPGENEIRIQKTFPLPRLASRMSRHFDVEFSIQELRRKRIRRIDIIADPKNVTPESNEYNNFASVSVPWPV
jgi:hypothetical protein